MNKMKKAIAVIGAATVCAGTFSVLVATNTFSLKRNLSRDNRKRTYNAADMLGRKCETLFIGDSITWLYNLKENFPGKNYINRGISGDKTTDILERCDFTFRKVKAENIVILAGVNDLFHINSPSRTVLDNLYKIIETAEKYNPDAKIFVESVYPVTNGKYGALHDDCTERIYEINRELSEKADEKGYTFIDIFSVLRDENDCFNEPYTYDGLHPSKEGFKVITRELKKYI